MKKYREGDVVLVEAVVRHDFDPSKPEDFGDGRGPRVFMRVGYIDVAAPVEQVQLLRPFFKKGERVIHRGPAYEEPRYGEILAINGDVAWVMYDGEPGPLTVQIKALEIEPPPGNVAPLPLEENSLPPPATPEI